MQVRGTVINFCLFQVLEEFYNIFGPELKSVIGDPKKIEDVVKRVDNLVKPIKEVTRAHKLLKGCVCFAHSSV